MREMENDSRKEVRADGQNIMKDIKQGNSENKLTHKHVTTKGSVFSDALTCRVNQQRLKRTNKQSLMRALIKTHLLHKQSTTLQILHSYTELHKRHQTD